MIILKMIRNHKHTSYTTGQHADDGRHCDDHDQNHTNNRSKHIHVTIVFFEGILIHRSSLRTVSFGVRQIKHMMQIWGVPEMGAPPLIIHFRLDFP